ncbi:putative chromosome segregation protein [Erysiphe neolycopersici]|uniref:Putative chromosome segregation protein n=1 Tax=Erysiphe neolycopersici TaxID=212602 RepID=A0A420HAQ6_9PEZI|nr:putative chromosome segregation protein [Erysiphe neolycopersici]
MTPRKKKNAQITVPRKKSTASKISEVSITESIATSTNVSKVEKRSKRRLVATDEISGQSCSELEEAKKINEEEVDETIIKAPPPEKIARKTGSRSKIIKEISAVNHDNLQDSPKLVKTSVRIPLQRKGRSKKVNSPVRPSDKVILESQETEIKVLEGKDENVEWDEILQGEKPKAAKYSRVSKRRRTSSLSDLESENHKSSKRKIEEINKRYHNLQLKYDEVVELGIKEAEKNFDKLRRQNEEIISISNKCLYSLKTDLKNQISLVNESKSLEKKLSAAGTEIELLQTKIRQLEGSLADIQAENKTLSAKLSANRTAAVSVESVNTKVPSSAIKANGGIRMMGTVEAALTAQAAQLKEDMYSDLTGLLMRSVTRGTDKDYFDCIQTGRNGSKFYLSSNSLTFVNHPCGSALHFKLAVGNEASADSYDDIQCSYTPLLDPNRDKMLMELLPDYLVDEITFPRPHATKFYARVVRALTEKSV